MGVLGPVGLMNPISCFIEVTSGPAASASILLIMRDLLLSLATVAVRTCPSKGRVGRGMGLDSEDLVLRSCLSCPGIWQVPSLF